MAQAIGRCGNTRVYVAKTRDALFPGHDLAFAERYRRPLNGGWYVDTNLNHERMRRILPVAVGATGLRWGEGVRVFWRVTSLS